MIATCDSLTFISKAFSVGRKPLSAGGLQIFCTISVHSAHTPALFIEEVRFLKNHRRGDKNFLLKMGGRVFYIVGFSLEAEGVSTAFH